MLFFQCIAALLNPVNRRGEGIKWGLISYTMVMFSVVTVLIAVNLDVQSISFIDNREFTNPNGTLSGPLGYQSWMRSDALRVIPNLMFLLNNWLADGLLVRRLFGAAFTRSGVDVDPSSSSIVAMQSIP